MTGAEHQRFQLRGELGRGGMGAVFEAFDTERNETVALKMLHRCDPEVILSLKQEFRSLSEIAHRNLVAMYELLGRDGQWFFTMEYIRDGRDLLRYIYDGVPLARSSIDPQLSELTGSDVATLGDIHAADLITLGAGTPKHPADKTSQAPTLSLTFATAIIGDPDATIQGLSSLPPPQGEQAVTTQPRLLLPLPPAARIARTTDAFRQLAEGVYALHALGKLHRDLKPSNVMVRNEGSVVILDFGLATATLKALKHSRQSGETPVTDSDGMISGTIPYMSPEQAEGRALTEASDWYAFGTMLFEALTGDLPFHGDAFSILRAKIAGDAPDVRSYFATTSPDLTQLTGLCDALLRRNASLRPAGYEVLRALGVEPAEEATLDNDAAFVGRGDLLRQMRESFALCRERPMLLSLHGRSGSGKTVLMEHFLETLDTGKDVKIFCGRCYEQESVPYKTLDGVADGIAGWLAGQDEQEQQACTPQDANALARIFPVFLRVPSVASAKAAATFDLSELRRRAFAAFGELLALIGRRSRLVLCVDDLQWGDSEGVEMLQSALAYAGPLLLLVTYRDEYLETSSALRAFEELEQHVALLDKRDIAVEPLDRSESLDLLHRLLPADVEPPSAEVLDALLDQAQGNAYFLSELARHYKSGASAAASNLDDVLWTRICHLAARDLRLLETIAVSGQPIRLRNAQTASDLADLPASVLTSLRMHRLVRSNGLGLGSEVQTYHDRIRETVLAHLEPERRRDRHVSLAVCLEAEGDSTPDTLATHFELGGRLEQASGYYESAASGAVQTLAFTRAETFYQKAASLTAQPAVRTRVAERLVHLYTDLARFPEAYATGRAALAELDLSLPPKFVPPVFALDLLNNWRLMCKRRIREIPSLPESTSAVHIAQDQMLAAIGKAAFQMRPELCIAILLKLVNACLQRGNTRDSAIGYMAVGSIFLGGIVGRYKAGYEYGQASLRLVDRYNATRIRAEVNFVVGYFAVSWRRPAAEAEALWTVARESGSETGDLFHVGCASCATVMSQWMRGAPLEELAETSAQSLELVKHYGLHEPRHSIEAVRHTVEALREGENGIQPDSSATRPEDFGSRHFGHHSILLEMQRHYLYGRYEEAISTGKRSAGFLADSRGMLHSTEHFFYLALSRIAIARQSSGTQRWRTITSTHRTLRRFDRWAAGSPENFEAKAALLRADWNSLAGRTATALPLFSSAAETAMRYHQPHIAALANQRAAACVGDHGASTQAGDLTAEAARLYDAWGAKAYAAWLKSRDSEQGHTPTAQGTQR